jgi:hypothetical protein
MHSIDPRVEKLFQRTEDDGTSHHAATSLKTMVVICSVEEQLKFLTNKRVKTVIVKGLQEYRIPFPLS